MDKSFDYLRNLAGSDDALSIGIDDDEFSVKLEEERGYHLISKMNGGPR